MNSNSIQRNVTISMVVIVSGALLVWRAFAYPEPCTSPSITTQPISRTDCQGTTASFTVVASGSAVLNYQWQKGTANLNNGGNISGATSATLSLANVSAADAGNYRVIVSNNCGTATSAYAVLSVSLPPTITTQPGNQTKCVGETALFSVTATGTGLTFQWETRPNSSANWVNVSGGTPSSTATGSTYTTPATGTSDNNKQFRVKITGSCATIYSTPAATLTVNSPPSITTQPGNQTVCVGATAQFTVVATGSGLTFQWQERANSGANWLNVSGGTTSSTATSSTYTTPPTEAESGKQYQVIVTGACNTLTSQVAGLSLRQPPIITSDISDTIVISGAAYAPANGTYKMDPLNGWEPPYYKIMPDGQQGQQYIYLIQSPYYRDWLIYDNDIEDAVYMKGGLVSGQWSPTQPNDSSVPTSVFVKDKCPDSSAILKVATEFWVDNYEWLESTDNGSSWHAAPGDSVESNGLSVSSYTVSSNPNGEGGRQYKTIVNGPCGSVESSVVTMRAATNLAVFGPYSSAHAEGSSVTLNVTAIGSGFINYTWKHDGELVSSETDASLSIPSFSTTSAGEYSVEVAAECGNTTKTVTLSIAKNITYGQPATFSVSTLGYASPTYKWKRNGIIIGGATSNSHTESAPPVSASGDVYEVVVSKAGLPDKIRRFVLTVNRAVLTVTAGTVGSSSRAYGDPNPAFNYTYSGFVLGQNQSVLTGQPVVGSVAHSGSSVTGSPYPIIVAKGTLSAANYSFNFVSGALTVTKVNLSVSADSKTKIFGDVNPPLTGIITGIRNGDPITSTFTTTVNQTTAAGTYANIIIPSLVDPVGRLINYNVTVDNAGTKGDFVITTPGVTINLPAGGVLSYMLGRPPTPLDGNASISGTFGSGFFNNKKFKAAFTSSQAKDYLSVRNYRKDGEAFIDNFNRSDADNLGTKWTEVQGNQAIVSYQLGMQTGSSANNLSIYTGTPCGTINQYACVTIPTAASVTSGNPYPYVVLRYTDPNSGHYRVVFQIIENVIKWFYHSSISDNTGTQIGSATLGVDIVAGDKFGVTITGTGVNTICRIWRNPLVNTPVSATEWDSGSTTLVAPLVTFQNPATAVNTGSLVGLGGKVEQAGGIKFDTFFAGDIPVAGTATEIKVTPVDVNIPQGTRNITYGGTLIATCTGGTPTSPLVVTFNAAATQTSVEAVLKNICFYNTSTSPSEANRSVQMGFFSQADVAESAARDITIHGTCPGPNAIDVVLVIDKTGSMSDNNSIDAIGAALNDNFNSPNSDSLGANWTEVQGDQDIVANQLSLQTGGGGNNLSIYSGSPCVSANQYACVTIPAASTTSGNPYPYVVLRYTDATVGHYRVVFEITENLVKWYYHATPSANGVLVETSALVSDAGDKFGITITGSGNSTEIRVWKNPVANTPVSATLWDVGGAAALVLLNQDPTTAVNTGNLVGLGGKSGQSGGITFDNFYAGDLGLVKRIDAAKNAAKLFLNYLNFTPPNPGDATDRAELLSFCGEPGTTTNPKLDVPFSNDRQTLINAINAISTCPDTVYHPTLILAHSELSKILDEQRLPLIVYLTDGEITGANPANNKLLAQAEAVLIRENGIRLITIGLGNNIANDNSVGGPKDILKNIASSPEDFWLPSTLKPLTKLYGDVANTICHDSDVNHPPRLTRVTTLTGARENFGFPISYDELLANSDAHDDDAGDIIQFRVVSVSSGTLNKNLQPVVANTTLLGPGETLIWKPGVNAYGSPVNAFTVLAWDGYEHSDLPAVQVTVNVSPANNPPIVNAGPDLSVPPGPVQLAASIGDPVSDPDNRFTSPPTVMWTRISGPGDVAFEQITTDSSPTQEKPTVIFTVAGHYVLRLTASDGQYIVSDEINVDVCAQRDLPLDVAILLDVSGSMMGKPFEDAKMAITKLIGDMRFTGDANSDAIALVPFGFHIEPGLTRLERNPDTIYTVLEGVFPLSWTFLTPGVTRAVSLLNQDLVARDARPVIVIVSDFMLSDCPFGGCDDPASPLMESIQAAKDAGMRIITVGFNLTDENEQLAQALASSSLDMHNVVNTDEFSLALGSSRKMDCGATETDYTITAYHSGYVPYNSPSVSFNLTGIIRMLTVNSGTPVVDWNTINSAGGTITFLNKQTLNPQVTVSSPVDGGDYTFRLTVDIGGMKRRADITVKVVSVSGNRVPEPLPDIFGLQEDASVTVLDVLQNDSDPDGDGLYITSVIPLASLHGAIEISSDKKSLKYTPNPNFNTPSYFEEEWGWVLNYEQVRYSVNDRQDGSGLSADGTVAIRVIPVNEPPIANPDFLVVPRSTSEPQPTTTLNVLANDINVDEDEVRQSPADKGLKIVSVSPLNPQTGTLKWAGGPYPFIVLRYDGSAHYRVQLQMAEGLVKWLYCSSSGDAGLVIESAVLTSVPGDKFAATVTGTDGDTTIRIWKNPSSSTPVSAIEWDAGDTSPDVTFTANPPTSANTGNLVGLGGKLTTSGVITFDNFFAGDIAGTSVSDNFNRIDPANSLGYWSRTLGRQDIVSDKLSLYAGNDPSLTIYNDGTTPSSINHYVCVTIPSASDTLHLEYTPATVASDYDVTFTYTIQDSHGSTATAEATISAMLNPEYPPVAVDDTKTAWVGTTPLLHVLENDYDPNAGQLVTVNSITATSVPGVPSPDWKDFFDNDGTSATYPLKFYPKKLNGTGPGNVGAYTFSYTIKDNGNTSLVSDPATITIKLTQPGPAPIAQDIEITVEQNNNPGDIHTEQIDFLTAGEVAVGMTLDSYTNPDPNHGSVVRGGPGNNSLIYTPKRALTPGLGYYGPDSFTYTVKDAGNRTATATVNVTVYLPVSSDTPPVAELTNVGDDPGWTVENIVAVNDGVFVARGTANDADANDAFHYELNAYSMDSEFYRTSNDPVASSRGNTRQFPESPDTDVVLGNLDLRSVPDGVYEVELVVFGGRESTVTSGLINLQSSYKVGNLKFSETDLTVNLAGVPVSVIRSYDSIKGGAAQGGDYGPGWTFDLNDMQIEINETRKMVQDEESVWFSRRSGGGRDVSLTMPNGRRVTFPVRFTPDLSVLTTVHSVAWDSPPGVAATLAPANMAQLIYAIDDGELIGSWWTPNPSCSAEKYDISGFRLTMPDGTVYHISRDYDWHFYDDGVGAGDYFVENYGKPKVSQVTLPTGDNYYYTKDGVDHQLPGQATRIPVFRIERNIAGLIKAVHDRNTLDSSGQPIPNSNPAVVYEYENGHLVRVNRLRERSEIGDANPNYDTTYYEYKHPVHDHLITSIKDARKVEMAKTLYDDQGRLQKVEQPDGRFVKYEYDLAPTVSGAAARQKIVDSEGNETVTETDAKGNALLVVDAKGNRTSRAFDPHNNPESEVIGNASGTQSIVTGNNILYHGDTDQIQRLLAIENPGPNADRLIQEFDATGRLKKSIDVKNTDITVASATPDPNFWMEYHYDDESNTDGSTTTQPTKTLAKWKTIPPGRTSTELVVSEVSYFPSGHTFQGFPKEAKSASGGISVFAYCGQGDPDGRFGDLKAVTLKDASGLEYKQTAYRYDSSGNRTHEIRRKKNGLVWEDYSTSEVVFDARGRVTETIDPLNGHTYTAYNASGRVESSTDRYGAVTRFKYNALGELIQTEYPDVRSITHSISQSVSYYAPFDDGGGTPKTLRHEVTTDTYFLGETVSGNRTIFDEMNRPIRVQRLKNVVIRLVADVGEDVQKTVFVSADPISTTQTKYDFAGRAYLTADANEKWTLNEYDDKGRNWRTKAFVNANGADISGTTITTLQGFDYTDKTLWRIDANQYAYLLANNPSAVTGTPEQIHSALYGNSTTPSALRVHLTHYEYDEFGRLVKTYYPSFGTTVTYTVSKYDDAGRQWLEIDADGKAKANVYDVLGRLSWIITDVDVDPAPPASLPVTLPTTRAAWETWARGDRAASDSTVTQYEYDDLGRLKTQTDARGNPTQFTYDALDRRTRRTLPDNSYEEFTYDFTSPGSGSKINKMRYRDFGGRYILTINDVMGRTVSRAPAGQEAGVTPLTAAASRGVTFTYTASGQRASMTEGIDAIAPLAPRNTYYAYDEFKRLRIKQHKDVNIYDTLSYTYDVIGRVKEISARRNYPNYSDSTWNIFQLDSLGTTGDRPAGAHMEYTYDARDRLDEVISDSIGTAYNYDTSGNMTAAVYNNGVQNTYEYNSRNQLRYLKSLHIGLTTTPVASFDYDDFDSTDGLTWPAARRLKPSGMRQGLAEIIHFNSQQYRRTLAYDNDNLGRLRAERIRSSTGSSWPTTANSGWANDTIPATPATGDLLYDVTPGYGDTSGYDQAGNRRSRTAAGVNVVTAGGSATLQNESGLSYDVNDRLNYVAPTIPTASYDANGNARYQATYVSQATPGLVQPNVSNLDEYDFDNRLIRRHNGAKNVTIVYDGDGNRIKKVVDDGTTVTTTRYLVDDFNPTGYAQVLEEQDASGNPTVTYVYGSDLISQQRGGAVSYYGYDGQGTVRYLTDNTGLVTDTYDYDAFGILTSTRDLGTATENHYLFAGEQWDTELGMYYLRARYYHPDVDRFWSMDTFEGTQTDPLSLHKYLYAHANPVNGIDPSGHEFNLIGQLATIAINAWTGIKAAYSVYNAYSRAKNILDNVEELAIVMGAIADAMDDEDDDGEVLAIITEYVQGKIIGAVKNLVTSTVVNAVAGPAGNVVSSLTSKAMKSKLLSNGIANARKAWTANKKRFAGRTKTVSTINGDVTIKYKSNGCPDFSPYAIHTVNLKNTPAKGLTGSYSRDFTAADKAAGLTAAQRKKLGTWHHNEKMGKMELVPKEIHGKVEHMGACAIYRQMYGTGYGK